MSARRRPFAAALATVVLAAGLAVIPALPASANAVVCGDIGGAWNVGTTTCTVSGVGAVNTTGGEVQLTGNLVVTSTGSLTSAGVWTFRVSGATTIAGSLTLVSGGMSVDGGATVTGNGQLSINTASFGGDITLNGPGAVATGGTGGNVVVLDGTFNITSTTTGSVTNSDIINSSTSLTGLITNLAGTFTNTIGTLNGPAVVEGGTFANQAIALAGITVNGGTLTNSVFGNISGATTVAAGAAFTNSAQVGTVSNAGTFTNAAGGTSGAVTNTGMGSLVNDGIINGGVTHSSTGTFTGTGTTTPAYPQTVAFSTPVPSGAVLGGSSTPGLTSSAVGTSISLSAAPAGTCGFTGSTLTYDAVGTCTITALRSANGNFAAASATQSFVIAGLAQTVTFVSPLPTGATVGGSSTLAATASSGEAVTFSSNAPAVCTVSGATVTYVAAGTCEVVATQAGNAQFASATATRSFAVARPATSPTGSGLADTGVNPLPGVLVALLTLLAGAGLLVVRRAHAARS